LAGGEWATVSKASGPEAHNIHGFLQDRTGDASRLVCALRQNPVVGELADDGLPALVGQSGVDGDEVGGFGAVLQAFPGIRQGVRIG
jgi:hypothetical protein